ncbi:MAG: hypothetical protein ACXWNY_14640, partial [Gemmatimonadaceae bacterium]
AEPAFWVSAGRGAGISASPANAATQRRDAITVNPGLRGKRFWTQAYDMMESHDKSLAFLN